ncbi:MAG: rRNA maturation RNAse YbeY [Mailhella sp.]|nr:rRNA maturation RNAse YbeY [Mailhella sp.]
MGIAVEMRSPACFCRSEWRELIRRMIRRAAEEGMLPGQACGPRAGEDLRGRRAEEMDVLLVVAGDGAVSAVNMRRLGCTGPTNNQSFPGTEGELGELFLSAETLERECVLYGQPPRAHAVRLLAHGMAHIMGFDHGEAMYAFCARLEAACADMAGGQA